MTAAEQIAMSLASLPPDQQKAIVAQLAAQVEQGWAKQWGALPLGEPPPHPTAKEQT